jgi:hypothetical protein
VPSFVHAKIGASDNAKALCCASRLRERTFYGICPFMDVALRDQNRRVASNFGQGIYVGPSFCQASEGGVAQHVGLDLLKNGKSLSRAVPWRCCD